MIFNEFLRGAEAGVPIRLTLRRRAEGFFSAALFPFSAPKNNSSKTRNNIYPHNCFQVLVMGQKRQRDQKGPGSFAKKRKKSAKPSDATAEDSDWDGIVGMNELNWKEVALPDRLEDAGGFFGLEEIEGVDIIRSEGNGEIKFKVCSLRRGLERSLVTPIRQRLENRKSQF